MNKRRFKRFFFIICVCSKYCTVIMQFLDCESDDEGYISDVSNESSEPLVIFESCNYVLSINEEFLIKIGNIVNSELTVVQLLYPNWGNRFILFSTLEFIKMLTFLQQKVQFHSAELYFHFQVSDTIYLEFVKCDGYICLDIISTYNSLYLFEDDIKDLLSKCDYLHIALNETSQDL